MKCSASVVDVAICDIWLCNRFPG